MKNLSMGADNVGMDRPRAIIAVRVSSEEQRDKGYGHRMQLARLPEPVREQGWELATRPDGSPGIYDEGAASTTPLPEDTLGLVTRPVLDAQLKALPQTRPTYVVCRVTDRLHRNQLQWQFVTAKVRAAGTARFAEFPSLRGEPRIVSIGDHWERFVATVKAGLAELDKVQTKEKLLAPAGTARRRTACLTADDRRTATAGP